MTFRELISQWPSQAQLARDIGISYETVKKWVQRNSIPSLYWMEVAQAARARRIRGATLADLAEMQQRIAA